MEVIECNQGSAAWHAARLGKITASKISAVITPTGKPTANAARRRYALDLAVERLTKRPTSTVCTYAMQRGIDMEPVARAWYSAATGSAVNQVGFCLADGGVHGCSPDGLVGEDGAIEIKCPEIAHYCEIVATGDVDDAWLMQCQHVMYVTGRKWIDFVMFTDVHPFAGWIKRIEADKYMHMRMAEAVTGFAAEVEVNYWAIVAGCSLSAADLEFAAPTFNDDGDEDMTTGKMEGFEL